MRVGPHLIIPDKNILRIRNWGWKVETGASHRKALGNEVSQGTPSMPRNYRTIAMPRLLLIGTVLLYIEFPTNGLASLGPPRVDHEEWWD